MEHVDIAAAVEAARSALQEELWRNCVSSTCLLRFREFLDALSLPPAPEPAGFAQGVEAAAATVALMRMEHAIQATGRMDVALERAEREIRALSPEVGEAFRGKAALIALQAFSDALTLEDDGFYHLHCPADQAEALMSWVEGDDAKVLALAPEPNEPEDAVGVARRYFATPDDPGATWQEVVEACVCDMEAGNPEAAWGTLKALLAAESAAKEPR